MVRLIALLSALSWATTGLAEQVLREISWDAVARAGELSEPSGGRLNVDGDALVVDGVGREGGSVTVLTLEDPGIAGDRYAITGRVRYEGVEGDGYLEMWSCFAGKGQFFSRTLMAAGPMGKLTGSSDWRPFVLPFYSKLDSPRPDKLIVNVVLPGGGKVWLSPLRLVQYGPNDDPLAVPGQWWSDSAGGWVGAIFGTLLGCVGGLVGLLVSKGTGRSITFALLRAMQIVGVACLIAGVAAVIGSQPYGVYYPLLLIGILCPALGTGLTGTIRKRYDEAELRKMSAMDVV